MRRHISKSLLMVALITGLCSGGVQSASAADNLNTFALDEYVVTATRTMKQLQEVPASVSVVTAKDIEERNIMSVPDALEMLPGVYKNQASQGGIALRGFDDSNNILVMIDGIQVNNTYNGDVDWEMLPIDNVERIEVARGAGSSLYGGHAVAGVINIITKGAPKEKGVRVNIASSYGSKDTWKNSALVDIRTSEKLSFGVGYEKRESDGFETGYYKSQEAKDGNGDIVADRPIPTDKDGKYILAKRGKKSWEDENISANIKYDFDESKSLKYTYRHAESSYEYDYPISNVYVNGKPTFSGYVDLGDGKKVGPILNDYYPFGYIGYKEYDTHTLTYNDDDNKIQFNIAYLDMKDHGMNDADDPNTDDPRYNGPGVSYRHPGKTYSIDFQKAWENMGAHSIVAGLNYKKEEFNQSNYWVKNWKNFNTAIEMSKYKNGLMRRDGGDAENIAFFIQDEYKISEPLTMYLGLRYDRYEKSNGLNKEYNSDGSTKVDRAFGSTTYDEISPKVAFDFKADEATNFYASYGHSFTPPTLMYVYRNTGSYVANPDLGPETADTFEIGMKKKLSKNTTTGLSIYHITTDDKVAGAKKPGTSKKHYVNLDGEKRYGVEFEIDHDFDTNWSTYLNYAYQRGKVDGGTKDGDILYAVPKHLLHAGVKYNNEKFNALLECQYVSERQDSDSVDDEYGAEDAFFIVNTALNYKLSKGMTLQFGIDNIFDKEFYCDEATPGRTYYAGLRYSF